MINANKLFSSQKGIQIFPSSSDSLWSLPNVHPQSQIPAPASSTSMKILSKVMKIEKEKFTALSEKDQNLQLLRVGTQNIFFRKLQGVSKKEGIWKIGMFCVFLKFPIISIQ